MWHPSGNACTQTSAILAGTPPAQEKCSANTCMQFKRPSFLPRGGSLSVASILQRVR